MTTEKVVIFDMIDVQPVAGRPTRARGEDRSSRSTRAVETSTGVIEQSLTGFIETVKSMLENVEDTSGDYQMETVEVAAQVSTEGKVGFMGVGLGANASSSMKIMFKRRTVVQP